MLLPFTCHPPLGYTQPGVKELLCQKESKYKRAGYFSLELKTHSLGEAKLEVCKPESDLGARLLFPGQALQLVAIFDRGSLKTTAADAFFQQEVPGS